MAYCSRFATALGHGIALGIVSPVALEAVEANLTVDDR